MEGASELARVLYARAFVTIACVVVALVLLPGCAAQEPSLGYSQGMEPAGSSSDAGAGLAASHSTTPAEIRMPEGANCTVRTLFTVPVVGEEVVVSGHVAEMLAHNDFVLDDGTGSIHVVGDEDCTGFGVGDALIVTGVVNVEDSPFRVEIEAESVEVR